MISLSGISKTFSKGSPNEIHILNEFNFEIKKNDFIIVIGSNGSGKSTLLNILAGAIMQEKGSINLDGKNISSFHDFERSRWIARIFQNPLAGTAPDLTILENFRLASLRTKGKGFTIGTGEKFRLSVRDRIAVLNLGLENKLDKEMGSLSGGQRQALALLMSIMDDTKLLLLDEPTAALDPRTSTLIMDLADRVIREYGLTALLVTHNMKDVIGYGNRVVQMKEGKIIRDFRKESNIGLNIADVYGWFND
jgi:putative ABC transport system ATP-binding protein